VAAFSKISFILNFQNSLSMLFNILSIQLSTEMRCTPSPSQTTRVTHALSENTSSRN